MDKLLVWSCIMLFGTTLGNMTTTESLAQQEEDKRVEVDVLRGKEERSRYSNVSHYELWQRLFGNQNYIKDIRPVHDPRRRTNISFNNQLFEILAVLDSENSIKVSGHMELSWKDEFLVWDPAEFSSIKEIFVPSSQIWTPEISNQYNLAVESATLGTVDVKVKYNGQVTQYRPFITYSLCYINAKKFPFDVQNCSIEFTSWAHSLATVDYIPSERNIDLTEFVKNPDWDLLEAYSYRQISEYPGDKEGEIVLWPDLLLIIVIQREPFFYVFNFVMPSAVITIVAVIGFHFPGSTVRGVRKSKFKLGTTTLMSMSILMLSISNQLPKFSSKHISTKKGSVSEVPLIGLYYTCLMFVIAAAAITSSCLVLVERQATSGRAPPPFLRALLKRKTKDKVQPKTPPTLLSLGKPEESEVVAELRQLNSTLAQLRVDLTSTDRKGGEEWAELASILTIASLAFYLSVITAILIMFVYNDWY